MLQQLKDRLSGKVPSGTARSNQWPAFRKVFLSRNPKCAVCGGTAKLEAHHIKPFHLNPALELDATNLIALCEAKKNGINCHLAFGHLGNFKSFNEVVAEDSAQWNQKIATRPKS